MKTFKILLVIISLLLTFASTGAQDKRTTETNVADLLSHFPAGDNQSTDKLMVEMLSLGETGLRQICDQVIPMGTGDDTRPRFAIESLSRFLSGKNYENEKPVWEKICIDYATDQKDYSVKDFFLKQLQQFGGNESAEAVKSYLFSKEICNPALGVISAVGGKTAESILAESLKNKELQCAAAVMNTLAMMKSQIAVNEYITWASTMDINMRASALNALALSGSKLAYPVLLNSARDVSFRWEATGATSSLLKYAKEVGTGGDIRTMDKICKLVISKCDDNITIQNKILALEIYTGFHGKDALNDLIRATAHPNGKYRNAALRMSLSIPGSEVTRKWIEYFPKAIPSARPEIINMLGIRSDQISLPLITASLSDPDINVRSEAAAAIVKLTGSKSIPALIDYLMKFSSETDQNTAKSALMTVCGSDNMSHLVPVLKSGSLAARISTIELLAWNKDHNYFSEILPFTSSSDESLKSAAMKALASLAGPPDLPKLIELLSITGKQEYIIDIQTAIAGAAIQIPDREKRSSDILDAMKGNIQKEKIIPVLAKTGGQEALKAVLNEFENGNSDIRDVCFKTLSSWTDFSASTALFEICASGNKTYEEPAFEGYISQVKSAVLPDEEKLLLYKKIMPYALSADRKNEILAEAGKLKTYQALYFVGNYLDDPLTSATAAKAAMYIALPAVNSKAGLYGDLVKEILTRAAGKLQGQESAYDKEMVNKYLEGMPDDEGFKPMFNGKDLSGWQGLVGNPLLRAKMKPEELAKKQIEANKKVTGNWSVKDGCIWFNGEGDNLCSVKEYGDFEMLVDWKITKKGDSGIYLRGSPQVQIWDTSRVEVGAQVGSGGLYNNQINMAKPLRVADNPVGDWNSFRIMMIGEKVSVWLNGILVVDNVTLENYWDRKIHIFPKGPIELQAHGTDLAFRDIYVREITEKEYNLTPEEKSEGFVALFNGRNLNGWVGDTVAYGVEDGNIITVPAKGNIGNLYTKGEYSDFIIRFEFQLTHAANNGLGIRAPLTGDAAYVGMELQILDDSDPVYANLQPYQYHGSVYGVIPSRRGYQKPVGEWNYEEVTVKGTQIKIVLNGTAIVDGDIAGPRDNGTMDHKEHPGLRNKTGHIGFLGHGSLVKFRNIRVKDLSLSGSSKVKPPEPYGPVPSERQLAWHELEYYMFVHFTVNTFTDKEWGYGDEKETVFNPTGLDCRQWAKVARDAGMKGIIVTAKHHDGFCLWPSKFTSHSVKNSGWKNGKGDVLRELRSACNEFGLKLGVYLSPWDRNSSIYGTTEYLTYYRNQLHELLTEYGDIFEVWFDGANGGDGYYGGAKTVRKIDNKTYYDWANTHKIVRELQPGAVMFSDAGPDIRWVGNESGMGSLTNWCLLKKDEMYPGGDFSRILGEGHEDGNYWVPAEVDVSIRPGWFYHQKQDSLVRSPENLMELYYSSVGRNSNLLLNVPPDRRGLLHENDVKSLLAFRELLKKEFQTELAKGKKAEASTFRGTGFEASNVNDGNPETYWATKDGITGGDIIIDLGAETEVNRILLQEYIKLGQRVQSFEVFAFVGGDWKQIIDGTTIGHKIIRKFPVTRTSKIKITISKSKACPLISNVELYRSPGN